MPLLNKNIFGNAGKIVFLYLFGLLSLTAAAQPRLSDEARISLLTSAPYDEEVFTVYGHAALRVYDPAHGIDYIFNYGIFDFSKPNFVYRFTKGETDYQLGAAHFEDYVVEYQMRGSDITEQVLNLTTEEKERIWEALLVNYRPENHCATRPAAIIEKQVNGRIDYQYPYTPRTFRELINHCSHNHPWLTFGCDLALGSPTDRLATPHEMMFLPSYLKEAFSRAVVTRPDGSIRALVGETNLIEAVEPDEPEKDIWDVLTPNLCAWLFFGIFLALTGIEWHRRAYFPPADILLFLLAGAGGIVIAFLGFISEHPEYICHYGGTFLLKLISCDRDPIVWNRFGDRRLDDYAYVIDLERRTFEAYKGWNKTPVPQGERFYDGNEPSEIGYFPFREMGVFDLDNLPSFPDFINICNDRREEFGDA